MIQGRQKMKNGLYPFFWQHGEEHAILSEYMDKIAESGMKGVCIEARPHPGLRWRSVVERSGSNSCESKRKRDESLDPRRLPFPNRICEW